MHGTVLPTPAPTVLRQLLDDVMDGHDVLVLADAAEGRALLDEAAATLAKQRTRALHVRVGVAGGLGVADLLTQLGGRDPDSRDDRDLRQSFQALTVLDPACDRIALLVSGAHALQPSALRYIQLACRSNAGLRLVFAGAPSVLELLDPAFADLAARLERTPLSAAAIIALPAPTPRANRHSSPSPEREDPPSRSEAAWAGPGATPTRPSRRTGRGTLAALGMVALVLLGITIGRSVGPVPSHEARRVADAPPPAAPQMAAAVPVSAPASATIQPGAPETAAPADAPPPAPPQVAAAVPVSEPAPVTTQPGAPEAAAPADAPPPAPPQVAAAVPVSAPAPPTPQPDTSGAAAPAELPPLPAPQSAAAALQPNATPAPALLPTPEAAAAPPLPPLAEATPLAVPHPPHPAARHEPARSVAHAARSGPPHYDAWLDYYARPVPPPEARPPRWASEPYYGWNQADGPAYIGTFRPNANGVRSFTYGP